MEPDRHKICLEVKIFIPTAERGWKALVRGPHPDQVQEFHDPRLLIQHLIRLCRTSRIEVRQEG